MQKPCQVTCWRKARCRFVCSPDNDIWCNLLIISWWFMPGPFEVRQVYMLGWNDPNLKWDSETWRWEIRHFTFSRNGHGLITAACRNRLVQCNTFLVHTAISMVFSRDFMGTKQLNLMVNWLRHLLAQQIQIWWMIPQEATRMRH